MKKILVVDNQPLMRKFLVKLLKARGFAVSTAAEGLSALNMLEIEQPDIIFLDLIMPFVGGEKVCRVIRTNPSLQGVYLVILSAIAAEEDLDFRSLGAKACIAKGPFDKMRQHIENVLDQACAERPLDLSGEILGKEYIHQREVTRELLSTKKHFEVILQNMAEGIVEITEEDQIVFANPAAVKLIGQSEEKLLGTPSADLFRGVDRQTYLALLESLNGTPAALEEGAWLMLNEHQIALNLIPIAELDGGSIVLMIRDITRRKLMEAQLRQARKLEAIGTLAGGIAHDFNNLLMGIQGNASLMLFGTTPEQPHYEHIKNIERLVQNGSKLTTQLIGYARKGKFKVQPLDLNEIVSQTAVLFGRSKKEIVLRQDLATGLHMIEADQGQLEQVLLNIYVNAWQAMPGGGELLLQTANIDHVEIKGKLYQPKPGQYICLTITDNGVGMDSETCERVFDPFFTTKEMGRGTGLGLASSYGIIKGHGGYIDVQSAVGQGTTFTIYLPALNHDANQKQDAFTATLKEGDETILLVDDEEMIIEVGRRMLENLGYDVLTARSGQEALSLYGTHSQKIDLVILDLVMNGMSGAETFERLRDINAEAKVLLASGCSDDRQIMSIIKRGCHGFIQKPFNLRVLSEKLREILDP